MFDLGMARKACAPSCAPAVLSVVLLCENGKGHPWVNLDEFIFRNILCCYIETNGDTFPDSAP